MTLQARLVRFLAAKQGVWVNGAELGDRAHAAKEHYKHDTVSRRLRVLVEASRGIATTPEHIRAIELLHGGTVERREMKSVYGRVASVWYRYVSGEVQQQKYQYVPQADGSVLEVRM